MIPRRLGLLLVLLVGACATYTDEVHEMREAALGNDPERAVRILDDLLDVSSPEEVPDRLSANAPLYLLERGALLQGLGDYRHSARDLGTADEHLEVLDITRAKSTDLGRYLYSDTAVAYRAPPFERLLLNSLNIVNYLALGDYGGARVEARRYQVFVDYLKDSGDTKVLPGVLSLGSYLCGLAFEVSEDYPQAVRYYATAWRLGVRDADLRDRLVALLRVTGWRPESGEGGEFAGLLDAAGAAGALSAEEYARQYVDGQLVAVVQTGFVPYKVPVRMSLADALVWAGLVTSGPRLSASEVNRIGKLAAEGIVTTLNFPALLTAGVPADARPALSLDGAPFPAEFRVATGDEAVAEYERMKGPMMVAALTRLLTRVVAGQATKAAVEGATKKDHRERGELLGWLAGLAVEATLSAMDRPDTRGWTMLPGNVRVYRARLAPGAHRIVAAIRGGRERRELTMTKRGVAVVNFSRIR